MGQACPNATPESLGMSADRLQRLAFAEPAASGTVPHAREPVDHSDGSENQTEVKN
jgi:hypothetical protein